MLPMRLTAAMIVFALLTPPAVGLLAARNAEASVLLAGLAAILGVLMVAVLLADALVRPLVELANAVQALARDRSVEPSRESDKQHDNVVALQPRVPLLRKIMATVESASRPTAPGGAIATGYPERHCKLASAHAVGTYIDIVIPSDRRECRPEEARDGKREDATR